MLAAIWRRREGRGLTWPLPPLRSWPATPTKSIDDALDWLRYPDWKPGREPTKEQAAALKRAQRLAEQAKVALEDVVRAR
jgi:hypothetical protein